MISRRSVLIKLAAGAVLAAIIVGVGPPIASRLSWNLVWQDEFGGSGLDDAYWNAQDLVSPRNHELQYYTPSNVRVDGGFLRLTSQRGDFRGQPFSSAAVDTYQKFSFTYGRVEIRARLPAMGQGVWPALWMLGTGCNPVGSPCPWPTEGAREIDIVEAVNSGDPIYSDLHFGTIAGQSLSPGRCTHGGLDGAAGFHTYAFEWESDGRLTWYVDNKVVCERHLPGVFDTPMYLFLNTAVGGDWPGWPAPDTAFPQTFDIDYARVYQRR